MASSVTCSVAGCGLPSYQKNFCRSHYKRWWRHGDPLAGRQTYHGQPLTFLRAALVDPPDDCIQWPFAKRNGYPVVRYNGGMIGAHRLALELSDGPPPTQQHEAAHSPLVCHNKLCINPRHLRWAAGTENAADRILDGTSNRGPKHYKSKLTESQALSVRTDVRSPAEIAADLGMSRQAISDIKSGRNWSWL